MTEKCRICLTDMDNTEFISILNKLNEGSSIIEGIVIVSAVEVLEVDTLPQFICSQCYIKLDEFYVFRNTIISSDKILKQKLNETSQNNTETYDSNLESDYLEHEYVANDDTDSLKSIKSEEDPEIYNDSPKYTLQANISEKLVKKHECIECGRCFKKADHLNVHIAYKHLEKQFECNICNKKFARKYDLTGHSRVHTGARPFTCEFCGKSFASPSYFYVHKRIHTGIKKIKCNLCEKSFINSDQLNIHVRQKHTGERPFMCEQCSQAFTSSSSLFRHKRDVHDEKVPCPICRHLFSRRRLKDHVKRHKEREEGIKKFTCDQCGKGFTCGNSRKRHMVIHSGEKSFKCEVCQKSFNQGSTLKTHMRIHSMIMPFQCDICSKNFRYKHHLKLHCAKHHPKEKLVVDEDR